MKSQYSGKGAKPGLNRYRINHSFSPISSPSAITIDVIMPMAMPMSRNMLVSDPLSWSTVDVAVVASITLRAVEPCTPATAAGPISRPAPVRMVS